MSVDNQLTDAARNALRELPATETLAHDTSFDDYRSFYTESELMAAARSALDAERAAILAGEDPSDHEGLIGRVNDALTDYDATNLRSVINATGVVIHTNLGRSVLSPAAMSAVEDVAARYSTLEYDLETGARGSRHAHLEPLITQLTGAEAAVVVNNNAAAVMLVLAELAAGKEALISRGELIEIGGSFRIPDIMALSGVRMVEVGTTNKTKLSDYENAITEDTALILKVHPSNYRIRGFTETADRTELVALGEKHGIPVYEDQGSGVLIDLTAYGLPEEPTVGSAVTDGVAVVSCSGDKLLGGPQAGIIAGRADLIERIRKHPLMRALRPDKMTLAGLEATLQAARDEERAIRDIPTLRMLTMPLEELRARAEDIAEKLRSRIDSDVATIEVCEGVSRAGGGALPDVDIASAVVRIVPVAGSEAELQRALLDDSVVPIIVRAHEGAVLVDPRTLVDEDETLYLMDSIIYHLTGVESA